MPGTHTYALMEVSKSTYKEIMEKLRAAGYRRSIIENHSNGYDLDMHGIGLVTRCDHNWQGDANDLSTYYCSECGGALDK